MKEIMKNILKKIGIYEYTRQKYVYTSYIMMKIICCSNKKQKMYIKRLFKKKLGYEIDFNKEPITFNQKIQFRKLYDNNPLYAICADKYRVREYVKEKIGEEYLIPLYLVTDKLTIEQWKKLPNSFVAKANHNSGPVQIVKDKSKVDAKKIIKELNSQLKIDYGILSMEKYYSDIPRKIIIETFLMNGEDKDLIDYKFFSFKGEVKYCQVIQNRNSNQTIDFYDKNWKKQEFTGLTLGVKKSESLLRKPKNYELMLELASILSKDFDFVRVDFYNINGKIYFGELTFCPASGFGTFIPEEWNKIFGEFWNQPKLK